MQNPDPNSYELPPKQYVRYAGSQSSASSDGDKYHFRNLNPQYNLDYDTGDSPTNKSGGNMSGVSGTDTLDEETGGSSNSSSDDSLHTGSSASSMSSNARRTKQIAERPMMLYMIIL